MVSEPKPLPDELQIKEHLDEDLWRIHNPMFGPPHVLGNAGHPGMRPLLDAIKNNPTAKEALARLLAATEEGVSLSGGDTSAFRRHLRSRLKGAP